MQAAEAPEGTEQPRISHAGFVGRLPKLAWTVLTVVASFNALSAVGGAIAMFLTDGLGMPRSFLAGSPFPDFFVPALLLLVVVGGTQTIAAISLFRRRPLALFWAAFAGFTMVTWIMVETAIIRGFGLLQGLYSLTGVGELVLVLALLGIVSWMPASQPAARSGPARSAPLPVRP
jgi:hypothetical protein